MGDGRDVKVRAGDRVREVQLLVTLDPRDLDVSSRRAEAAREEVRSSVPEADSAIAAAKANLDLAQTTFVRMQELFQKTSISKQEFDESSAKLKAAQAAFAMTEARRVQLNSKLAQADQEVRATEVTRSSDVVLDPYAGAVVARSVEPGALAVPGGTLRRPAESKSRQASVDEAIHTTIGLTGGNLSAAARILGISRPTLTRKLRDEGSARRTILASS